MLQVATNALLERQGERTALLVTQGFADLLLIGNQTRSKIFELDIQRPELLYEMVAELPEDVILPLGSEANMRNGASPAAYGSGQQCVRCEGWRVRGGTAVSVMKCTAALTSLAVQAREQ